ncbi:pilus assembly protein PilM [Candidatus Uhrbacteria bacterium]|nr:pilus assembly protein PilM [Candidatus Uhrbacteria bacterium]
MRLFPYVSPPSIGIDCGEQSLKVAALKTETSWSGKRSYRVTFLHDYAVKSNDTMVLQSTLATVARELRAKHHGIIDATMSIPESQSYVLTIPEGAGDAQHIADRIAGEVPLPITDLYYDSQVVPPYRVIGAAPKEYIDRTITMTETAGMTIAALDFEGLATIRAIAYLVPKETRGAWGVIDFGATRTQCMIAEGETPLHTLRLPLSGEGLTTKIASTLHLAPEQAERTKRECGVDPHACTGSLKEILVPEYTLMAKRVHEMLALAHNQSPSPVSTFVLVGGGAHMPGLKTFLEAQLQCAIIVPDPSTTFLNDAAHDAPAAHLGFMTALGLALRSATASLI